MNFKTVKKLFRHPFRLTALLCALAIFGCSNASDKNGKNVNEKAPLVTGKNANEKDLPAVEKYVNEKSPDVYFELKNDGTFVYHRGKASKNGKYEIDGKRIIFKVESGKNAELKIEGKSLINKVGDRFTKQ